MYFVDHLYQLGPFCLRSEVIAGKKDECDEGERLNSVAGSSPL